MQLKNKTKAKFLNQVCLTPHTNTHTFSLSRSTNHPTLTQLPFPFLSQESFILSMTTLSTFYVSDREVGTGDSVMNRTHVVLALMEFIFY